MLIVFFCEKSGYCDFLKKQSRKRAIENQGLTDGIKEIYEKSKGWLYVGVVLDLFSRKVIGLSRGASDKSPKAQALCRRGVKEGLLYQSDRGSQYASKEFIELANAQGIKLSMIGKGHCYESAVAESFFYTLKTEHTNLCRYRIRDFILQ